MPVDKPVPEVKDVPDVKDYADGWITERKNTNVPTFLKVSYIVISTCCIAYLIVFMYGEVNHSERGPLVKEFIQTSQTSPALMYGIAILATLFFIAMIAFAFGKTHDE